MMSNSKNIIPNIKKIFILFILFFLNVTYGYSQVTTSKTDNSKAYVMYTNKQYDKALKIYKKQIKKNNNDYRSVMYAGDCSLMLKDTSQAIIYYTIAGSSTYYDAEILKHVISKLNILNKKELAKQLNFRYENLIKNQQNNTEESKKDSISETDNNRKTNKLKKNSNKPVFEISNLEFNTAASEIGPVKYENTIVFASNRASLKSNKTSKNKLYKLFIIDENNKLQEFDKNLKAELNNGPVCFNKKYNIAFITRNNSKEGVNQNYLNIYTAQKVKGQWQKEVSAISLPQKKFVYMHAHLDEDNGLMYFVSNKPGGYGGMDIYVSKYMNGFLSYPHNLGPNINTENNELFPYVREDGRLFFASNKIGGKGGLDIYYCLIDEGKYSPAYSMPAPINSEYDDFGIIYINNDDNDLKGYFCSNRSEEEKTSNDDIYSFKQSKKINFIKYYGEVVTKTSKIPINGVEVKLNSNGRVLVNKTCDSNGYFSFMVPEDTNGIITFKCNHFQPISLELNKIGVPINKLTKKINIKMSAEY